MTSSARLDDLQHKFEEDPRRYFAPLANEYRKGGDALRAVEVCRSHLPQQPGHLSGHVVLAQALQDLGELDAARRAFQDALALDPENVLVLRSLGDIARQSGSTDDARAWYERALGVDPRDPDVARSLAFLEQELSSAERTRVPEAQVEVAVPETSTEARPVADVSTEDVSTEDVSTEDVSTEDVSTEETPAGVEGEVHDLAGGEFTAGFFAAVTVETPLASAEVRGDEGSADQDSSEGFKADEPSAVGAPDEETGSSEDADSSGPAFGEVGSSGGGAAAREGDEIDRLFEELPPLDPSFTMPSTEDVAPILGTDLALADGAAVVPDIPELGKALAQEESSESRGAPPPPLASEAEGPVPLVADDWSISLEGIDHEQEAEQELDPGQEPEPVTISGDRASAQRMVDPSSAFVTETMAELYVQQGLDNEALQVYRQLLMQRPGDAMLLERAAELESRHAPQVAAEEAPTEMKDHLLSGDGDASSAPAIEPPAALWLRSLASARPAVPEPAAPEPAVAEPAWSEQPWPEQPAIEQPEFEPAAFGEVAEPESAEAESSPEYDPWVFEGELVGATPEPESESEAQAVSHGAPHPGVEAEPEVEAAPQPTLEELFARPVSASEEQAAGAIVAATVSLQADPMVDAQLGEVTAEDPAALQHLLRGTPRSVAALRQGASFSFDQFFRVDEPGAMPEAGESAGVPATPPAPAKDSASDESESDLADFHAWLSGLSNP